VWAWGFNSLGQLGNGTRANSSTPVPVSGLSGVTTIAAGSFHSLALRPDGTVWAWGGHMSGELDDGISSTPVQVGGLASGTAIAAGAAFSLVVQT
jgi:alpha-tubulin suppressor-like RCC1 family protein